MDYKLVTRYLRPLAPIPTGLNAKGQLQKPVTCLLCDLYGTLIISGSGDIGTTSKSDQHSDLIDRLLKGYGLPIRATTLNALMRQAIGDEHQRLRVDGIGHPDVRIEKIWESILPDMDPEVRLRLAVEFEMITNPVWPMPGAKRLLQTCKQKGIRLGIISNAQFYTPYLFSWLLGSSAESLGFDPDLTLYSYRFGRAKPSPELFNITQARLNDAGIDPTAVAYIGNDMLNDMVPAHRTGFQTVLFAGDKRSLRLRKEDTDCCALDPDMVVTCLDQLTAKLIKQPDC